MMKKREKKQRKNEKLLCKMKSMNRKFFLLSYSKLCVSHVVDEEIKVNLYRQRSQASWEQERSTEGQLSMGNHKLEAKVI